MNLNWSNLRFRVFLAAKTMDYTYDYMMRTYQIYLNHTKIIHWRNGYPVFSLSTPAIFSKPAANFFARQMYRSIQNRNFPSLLSFAINDICNAACDHCSFFQGVEDRSKEVLTLTEAQDVIAQAQELGVSIISIVGGEPLMREDLPKIIESIDHDLSTSVLFTNGWLLEERAQELKQAGLESIYISLDSASPKKHDVFRHKKGLFKKAVAGIQIAKKLGFSTGISTSLDPQGFKRGHLQEMIELAKEVGVHELIVSEILPTGRAKARKDLVDNDWADEVIEAIKPYNQDASYPGVVSSHYMTSHRSVGCSCGTSYFYVSPYGDIMSCDYNHKIYGCIREEKLYRIWDRLTNSDGFGAAKWGGCKIKDSSFRDEGVVATSRKDEGCACSC